MTRVPALILLAFAAACAPAKTDGIDPDGKAFDKVAAQEAVTLTGTEPFWTLKVNGDTLAWLTPDH